MPCAEQTALPSLSGIKSADRLPLRPVRLASVRYFNLLLPAFFLFAGGCAKTKTLVIYHTNDVQGFYWPSDTASGRKIGGYATLQNLLKTEKKPYLLLDSGNWFAGTPEGTQTKGAASVALMNMLGYTASGVGETDVGAGWDNLRAIAAKAQFPVLAANIRTNKNGEPVPLKPYVIKDISGLKVGIIGLVPQSILKTVSREKLKGMVVENEIKRAQKTIEAAKSKGANFIIALVHSRIHDGRAPQDDVRALAKALPEIGLIICANPTREQHRPVRTGSARVISVSAGLNYAGRAEVEVNPRTGEILGMRTSTIGLDPSVYGEDAAVATYLAALRQSAEKQWDKTITTAAELPHSVIGESQLGAWAADCLKAWGKSDAGIINSQSLKTGLKAGPVTERTLFEIFPSDDRIMLLKIRGLELRQALENALSDQRNFPQIAGMTVVFNPAAPYGRRVQFILLGQTPLSDNKIYRLATSDYMVSGADGYDDLSHSVEFVNTQEPVRKALGWCMRRSKKISPPAAPRWVNSAKK